MANLETTYMGIALKSPLVVAASSISNMIDRIERAEEHGAGALVIRSLFEEQALREKKAESALKERTYFPTLDTTSVKDHLMWTEKTRQSVRLPLIASLSCIHRDAWVAYSRALESTGVDGLELNLYRVDIDLERTAADIEQELFDTVEAVCTAIKIPVSVKLSPFFTSIANVAHQLDQRGVKAIVLFNRFLQPDINLDEMKLENDLNLSHDHELRLPLRWTALLYGKINADIALTTGIHTAEDMMKGLLAGAQVVQVASVLLKHGIPILRRIWQRGSNQKFGTATTVPTTKASPNWRTTAAA